MMVTPSSKAGLFSGMGLWALIWGFIYHVDSIPVLNKFAHTDKILAWIRAHRTQAFLGSEAINLATHAHAMSSPTLMPFVIGGSLVNGLMIFLVNGFVHKLFSLLGARKTI